MVVEPQDVGVLLLLNNLEPRMMKISGDDVISGKNFQLPVKGERLQGGVGIRETFVFPASLKIHENKKSKL